MRRFAVVLIFLLAGCAADQISIPDPEFALLQLTKMPDAASHVTGSFPVQYRLHIGNRATMPIILKNVNVTSVGMGSYDVPSTSRPFNVQLTPGQPAEVDFFVSANIQDPTIIGANGPVTLHGIVTFFIPLQGEFQKSFMLQANEMATQ